MKRMPASTIRVQYNSGTDDPETDVDMLTTLVEEKGRCDLACGTKRALVGGGRALNGLLAQLRYDPQPELPGGSWILTALPDTWKKLKAGSKMFRCGQECSCSVFTVFSWLEREKQEVATRNRFVSFGVTWQDKQCHIIATSRTWSDVWHEKGPVIKSPVKRPRTRLVP